MANKAVIIYHHSISQKLTKYTFIFIMFIFILTANQRKKTQIYMRKIVQAKPRIQVIKSITNTRMQCIFVNKLTKTLPCLQYVKMKPLFQYLTIKTIDKHFLIILLK